MAEKGTPLHAGDPCPNCGGDFVAFEQASAKQWAKQKDRDDHIPLPPNVDTAPDDVRDELGALHRCRDCGYRARFKADAAADTDTTPADSKKTKRAKDAA